IYLSGYNAGWFRVQWDDRIGRRLRLKDLHPLQTIAEVGSMAKAASRRALHTIAEAVSMSRASSGLALSQPAISKAIADMERTVGAALLDRTSRGVELTESGRLLVGRTRAVFDELRQGM